MTERTEWDDAVDEAIEVLIAEDTDGFALVAIQGEDVHSVQAADEQEELMAVWMMVRQVMARARERGTPLEPPHVLTLAMQEARERGVLGAEFEEI